MPRLVPVLGALALAAVAALTGCSAGQVSQTARQVSTVNGAAANIGDLALRDIRILYPSSGTYAKGSTAQLALVVVNRGLGEDRLVGVTGDFFDAAAVPTDGPTAQPTSGPTAQPTSGPTAQPGIDTAIPSEASLQFGTSDSPPIELTDLSEEISAAQVVSLTFAFENAGEVTVEVPVANPTREIDRGDGYNFNTDEQTAG
ncbi:MAG: PT domain-containing protein [Geodermatophilaceae bacterium]|nr:PT domain-containing protein [Geodermatophilaceae bacterium]